MGKYVRKTQDEYHVQGYYSREFGWETVTTEATRPEALAMRKCYDENEPAIPHRIIKKRVKKEETENGTNKQ